MIDRFLGDAFGIFSFAFRSTVLQGGARLWCPHLKLLDHAVSGARFLTEVCLSVTLLIVDPWQYCACCIRSGITRYTLLIVLYLDRMCQRGFSWCSGRTSAHLCAASLQNLAVQQDFYSLLGVPLVRSC